MRRVDVGEALRSEPTWFIALIIGIKDFLLGLAFVLGVSYTVESKLYQNFDSLSPGTTGPVMGWVLLLVGAWVVTMCLFGKVHLTRIALQSAATAWLFSFILYCLNGQWIFGFAIAMCFSLIAGYLSFVFRNEIIFHHK